MFMSSLLEKGGSLWFSWLKSRAEMILISESRPWKWYLFLILSQEFTLKTHWPGYEVIQGTWRSSSMRNGIKAPSLEPQMSSKPRVPIARHDPFLSIIHQPSLSCSNWSRLEWRWTYPTKPCPNCRFISKIHHRHGLNPLRFEVVCYAIEPRQCI